MWSHHLGVALLLSLLLVSHVQGQGCGVHRRRPWRSLSCGEQQQFLNAVQQMKQSGLYDEFVRIHQNSGNANHFVDPFLSFHRWHIFRFEQEMQRLTGTCVTIPYWDWENGPRNQVLDWVLQPYSFGAPNQGGCVSSGISDGWGVVQPGQPCLTRIYRNDIFFTRDVEILNRITNNPLFLNFGPNLEGAPHTSVHDYFGNPMEGFWAPDDPLFYLHHANVDRIYSLWQDYWDHDELAEQEFGFEQYSGNIDQPLFIVGDQRINMNRPGGGGRPTPRDLMYTRGGIVNVQYVDDNLAQTLLQTSPNYNNNPQWHQPGNAGTTGGCGGGGGGGGPPPPGPPPPGNGGGGGGPPPPPPQQNCAQMGQFCEGNRFCCSNRCGRNSRRCLQPLMGGGQPPPPPPVNTCQPRGAPCQGNNQCCSRRCNWNTGRCARSLRRLDAKNSTASDFTDEEEPAAEVPALSRPRLQKRWVELMDLNYQPERIFDILGREDCAYRARAHNTTMIASTSPDWAPYRTIPEEFNYTFDCHVEMMMHQ